MENNNKIQNKKIILISIKWQDHLAQCDIIEKDNRNK